MSSASWRNASWTLKPPAHPILSRSSGQADPRRAAGHQALGPGESGQSSGVRGEPGHHVTAASPTASLQTENWLVWSRGCVFYKQQLQENQKIRPHHCLHRAGIRSLLVLVAPDSHLQRENSPNQPSGTQLCSLPNLLPRTTFRQKGPLMMTP